GQRAGQGGHPGGTARGQGRRCQAGGGGSPRGRRLPRTGASLQWTRLRLHGEKPDLHRLISNRDSQSGDYDRDMGRPGSQEGGESSMVPETTVTARPASRTRSPARVTRTSPPRSDSCAPVSVSRPSLADQYGESAQCAEPVTGSSGTPTLGAKNRETKSVSVPGAVTMTPRASIVARASMSGRRARTVSAESTSTSRSRSPFATCTGVTPSAFSNPSGAVAGVTFLAGKSIVIMPSVWRFTVSVPLAVVNSTDPCAAPVEYRTCAVARV